MSNASYLPSDLLRPPTGVGYWPHSGSHPAREARRLSRPFAFVATYALGVGTVTFLNVAVFDMADPKFRELWMKSWLEMYWSLWSVYFAPSAISALLATWLSRLTKGKEAAVLLGAFLLLILAAIDAWVLDPYIGRKGPWFLLGAFACLGTVFLAIAMVARDSKTGPTRSLESS